MNTELHYAAESGDVFEASVLTEDAEIDAHEV